MLIRAVVDTTRGTLIVICDEDDKLLFFDQDDEEGPTLTMEKPEGLRVSDFEALTLFLLDWVREYDSQILVESIVIEALLGGMDLPPSVAD